MKTPKPTVIDFETFGIEGRPDYPPMPVGVAIKPWGKKGKYYAWGHVTGGNNSTKDEAVAALRVAYANPDGVLFHNAKFDIDVAEVHMGLAPPSWDKVHDSIFLLFLDDPHQRAAGLKEASERLLNMPPEERDVVADWLVEHQPVEGVKISRKPGGKEPYGKYIAHAPGNIVGPYALGDVERTEKLFAHLYPNILGRGMLGAYDRERRLVPILLDMERRGLRVNVDKLRGAVQLFTTVLTRCEAWLRKRIGCGEDVNLDSGAQLVDALLAAGLLDPSKMALTPSGDRLSTNKASLTAGVVDPQLSGVLRYVAQLQTCLNTFMMPWLGVAERSGGFIFTNWNQIRGGDGGTRTGRFSSTPNFQNIPKEFAPIFSVKRGDGLPKAPFKLPSLPLCRSYIIPYEGHVFCGRDFASQELRILAHFEDGQMLQSYIDKPDTDFHQYAADLITQVTGVKISRKGAKTIGFAILYGAGVAKLAERLGVSLDEAKRFLNAYMSVFPSIRTMQNDLKARSKAGLPIRTAGGREYYTEAPKIIDGRLREFSYKILNYLIQGSAADQTKDAMIRFHDAVGDGVLVASVHDEILISAPVGRGVDYMGKLSDAMADCGLDVPMLSDGKTGLDWCNMVECV